MTVWYLDLTAFANSQRVTGIQRVVRDVLDSSWGPETKAVYFSSKQGGYFELLAPPIGSSAPPSDRNSRLWRALWAAASWLWGATGGIRQRLGSWTWVIRLARRVYEDSRFRDSALSDQNCMPLGGSVEPEGIVLIDVPHDLDHLQHLKHCLDRGASLKVYLYDVMPMKRNELWSHELHKVQKIFFESYMKLVMRATVVVCMSGFTAREYAAIRREQIQLPKQQVLVSYPPVNLASLHRNSRGHVMDIAAEANVSSAELRVMAVAPLLRRKNLRVVFSAIERLQKNHDLTVVLRVVCPASASVDAQAWAVLRRLEKNPRVHVYLRRDISDSELVESYNSSQIVVVPSLYEGFGLPLLEASALGNCVVASDIPVFREIAQHLPIRLVDPESVGAWAAALHDCVGRSCPPQSVKHLLPSASEFLSLFLHST